MARSAMLIMGTLLLTQSTNLVAEEESPATRIKQIQQKRRDNSPSTAEYQLNGTPLSTLVGRSAKCRCYLDKNGDCFVEEAADEWTSQIWFRNNSVIWRYSEDGIDEAFVFTTNSSVNAENFLQNKMFGTCRMAMFDQSAVDQSKTSSLAVLENGFNLIDRSNNRIVIEYRWEKGLPKWKFETDKILSRIERGEINLRRIGDTANYSDCLDMIGRDGAAEKVLTKDTLAIVAKENGHLIPAGRGITIEKVVSKQRGEWLTINLKVDDYEFQIVEFHVNIELNRAGEVIDPLPPNMLLKRKKFKNGILYLVNDGGSRVTQFFGKNGSVVVYVGDVFDNKEFIRVIQGLE